MDVFQEAEADELEREYSTEEEQKKITNKLTLQKGIKKKYKQKKFNVEWLKLPQFKNWLLQGRDVTDAVCKVCNVTIKAGKSDLQKHALGKAHVRNIELQENSSKNQPGISSFVSLNSQIKNTEAAICTFLVENNLPISTVEPLLDFIKLLPDKSVTNKIQLAKQKATNVIRNGLRPFFQSDLLDKLKKTFFSVYIDETTDVSVKKQLAIMVSYCENFETKVDVIDLVDCPDGTAHSIYNELIKALNENKVPLENWIGFCSDTTSTMMGQHKSVAQLINKNHPQVHVIKCACHMIHLVASYACGKLSNSLEDTCRTIFNHFSRSPKNTEAFKEFQSFFDIKPHKMLKPSQTRWLSLQACVGRILEQWVALEHYWKILSIEDPTHANIHTHKSLQNLLLKCQMYFVEYNLGLFNKANTFFQADFPQFPELKPKIEELIKTLALNFMNKEYVKNTPAMNIDPSLVTEHVKLDKIYLGVQATTLLNEIENKVQSEVDKVLESAKQFYIEAIMQIKKRFVFGELYEDSAFLLPSNAVDMNPPTIYPIAKKYLPSHIDINLGELDIEWRSQSLLTNNADNMFEYWKCVSTIKENGKPRFTCLPIFVKYFLSLPFSNAAIERLFSAMKTIKTEKRNRLDNETITSLLSVKYGLKRMKETSVNILKNQLNIPQLKFVQANATASQSKQIRLHANEDV